MACRDGEGFINVWRANTVYSYRSPITSYNPVWEDLWSPAATPIRKTNDYNPSGAWRRQLPLLKGAFKLGLFVRIQGTFSNCRGGIPPSRSPIRTAEDVCPYSEKTSVYLLTYQKKALRARRVKQTVRWTVCSQSGEQFIIATRGFKPGTQSR